MYKNINDNVLANQWKQRYSEQPQEKRDKLDLLFQQNGKEYQLEVIKKSKILPQKGDRFVLSPKPDLYFAGCVLNDDVSILQENGFFVIAIFENAFHSIEQILNTSDFSNLLLPPCIVSQIYWKRGYFYNIDVPIAIVPKIKYGFYDIMNQKFCNEYGEAIQEMPQYCDPHGICTVTGVAYDLNKELIIMGII